MGIDPQLDDVGRKVLYLSSGGETIEEGVIVSFNDAYVFVRFGAEQTAKACRRDNLEFIFWESATLAQSAWHARLNHLEDPLPRGTEVQTAIDALASRGGDVSEDRLAAIHLAGVKACLRRGHPAKRTKQGGNYRKRGQITHD